MGRTRIFEKAKLKDMHKRILNTLEECPLSTTDIAKRLVEKNPNLPEVTKWGGYVGDVARYVVARYLTYLKNRGYVELNDNNEWELIRKETLRNEVIRGLAEQWQLPPTEVILKLLDIYIEKDNDKWKQYVKTLKQYERVSHEIELKQKKAIKKLEEAFPLT